MILFRFSFFFCAVPLLLLLCICCHYYCLPAMPASLVSVHNVTQSEISFNLFSIPYKAAARLSTLKYRKCATLQQHTFVMTRGGWLCNGTTLFRLSFLSCFVFVRGTRLFMFNLRVVHIQLCLLFVSAQPDQCSHSSSFTKSWSEHVSPVLFNVWLC